MTSTRPVPRCAAVPNLKKIAQSPMRADRPDEFPPSCESRTTITDADGPVPRVMVSRWDGHSVAEEIQRGSAIFPAEVGAGVFTRVVNRVTVVLATLMPYSDRFAKWLPLEHHNGDASAAIASAQTQWIDVSVRAQVRQEGHGKTPRTIVAAYTKAVH